MRNELIKFLLGLLVCFSVGCNPSDGTSLREQTELAFNKAKSALLCRPEVIEIDVVWLLQDMLNSYPDDELQQLVHARTAAFATHPLRVMIDPYAQRIQLPAVPGKGMELYYLYMQAPFGEPRELAVQYISEYLSRPEKGYMLTHQLLSIIWAAETGLDLPETVVQRKDTLLNKIYEEQSNDSGIFYMDLYAERVAFLLRYGKVSQRDAEKWIERLVQMQNADGNWPSTHAVLQYEGQFGSSLPPPPHTTVLAMTALKNFMEKY